MAIAWACYATGLGAWLVAGFAHWRFRRVVPAWIMVMACVFAGAAALDWADHLISRVDAAYESARPPAARTVGIGGQSQSVLVGRPHDPRLTPVFDATQYAHDFGMVLATLVLTVPGALIGTGLRAVARASHRRSFRKRLARRRRRRYG